MCLATMVFDRRHTELSRHLGRFCWAALLSTENTVLQIIGSHNIIRASPHSSFLVFTAKHVHLLK